MPVLWAPQAVSDVLRIKDYIAADNPAAALRIARELVVAADSLAMFPRRGRPTTSPGYRELVTVRPYIIVYRILGRGDVDILRVWHAAQDR